MLATDQSIGRWLYTYHIDEVHPWIVVSYPVIGSQLQISTPNMDSVLGCKIIISKTKKATVESIEQKGINCLLRKTDRVAETVVFSQSIIIT